MPQTGPRRQNVAIRLLDDELELLRASAHATGNSLSDLLRGLLRLPPADKVLARRSTPDLRSDLAAHAAEPPFVRALWAAAIHRVLETRFPASVAEFLDLYTARLTAYPDWVPDGSRRTVLVDDDLEVLVGFGGPEPVLRLAPRIPSQNRALPTAVIRGAELPGVEEMRDLLADTARRARRIADTEASA